MNEQRDPFESRGDRKGRHFGVGAKGGHCKQDSFICLLQEGMKYPSAGGLRDSNYLLHGGSMDKLL
jgi:hypothetical protein